MDRLVHSEANARRISIIEGCFGASGAPLGKPGRVLIGEGMLTKLCRKKAKPRQFFLFNDILVYGSIVINKKKYSRQHVVPLEAIRIEELEDEGAWKNGWQIITPKKSFAVFAGTATEKKEWMAHIQKSINDLLAKTDKEPAKEHAAVWVPDGEAQVCMHCRKTRFTPLNRRHHCRKCGNVVCGQCSTKRYLIPSISQKPMRVCDSCFKVLSAGPLLEGGQAQAVLPQSTFASELNKTGTRHKHGDEIARYGSSDDDDDNDEVTSGQPRTSFYSDGPLYSDDEEGDYSVVH